MSSGSCLLLCALCMSGCGILLCSYVVLYAGVVQAILDLLCDPTCLLGMATLLPLIESLDSLITFSHKRNVFICDFIGVVKVCEGQLYSMYNCHSRAFTTDEFFVFKNIAKGTHDHIHTRWVQNDPENPTMFDLNCDAEHLAFVVNGNNMYAKRRNEETGKVEPITCEAFAAIVEDVKTQCLGILTLPSSIFW